VPVFFYHGREPAHQPCDLVDGCKEYNTFPISDSYDHVGLVEWAFLERGVHGFMLLDTGSCVQDIFKTVAR